MKAILFSIIALVISYAYAWMVGDFLLLMTICLAVGSISLLISAIFSGSLVSGDQYRANTATEDEKEATTRTKVAIWFSLFSIPQLFVALIIYLTK
ncbi:DUF5316 domain-containing protein [Brevibacillus daliensis]|uniref:DUF5316 domain-containing protein n=1 Tax=Brevibacillus daliensis TaxID=2892995 RepID=UPI001E36966B|nr:DUF5316 domain-containing protein [Brevibacillus daliensis]